VADWGGGWGGCLGGAGGVAELPRENSAGGKLWGVSKLGKL